MKSFDLRAAFIEKPAQGQQILGGHNSANNCVPDSLLECYQALTGKWPCNPQDITAAVYGANYIGGETFGAVVGFMQRRRDLFPALPALEVHDFGSQVSVDAIGDAGAQGFPMAVSFYCDANGVILPHWSPILHASCPVAGDGNSIWVWNVEGYEVRFSLADFTRAYQGALVVFQRNVHASPTADAASEVRVPQEEILGYKNKGLAHSIIKSIYQRVPTDAEMNDFVANVHDNGDNLADIVQGYENNVAKGTPLEQRVTALEDKPAGTPGPAGPAGPAGPPGVSPKHFTISGTADAV